MDRYRTAANLATLANALVGVGAVAYVLAGNKLWAMLLIVSGVGFDGLDGFLSRKSSAPAGAAGRIADSLADAITFGVAPGVLVAVHTDHAGLWAPWTPLALAAGILVATLAIARLVYFTLRGFRLDHFLGAPTPQTAIALVLLTLAWDRPAFAGTMPGLFLAGAAVLAVLMVLPVPFPKVRRGSPIRPVATVTSVALVVALLPLQFVPSPGTPLYLLAAGASGVALLGTAAYYLWGPFLVPAAPAEATT